MVSFYAMLNQPHPALTLNKIELEPQYPTSRQLPGHASMQVLGRFWSLAGSFRSTERNYNNSINWDFPTATGNCWLASWDKDKDSRTSCGGHIQHPYRTSGDCSTFMLIMSLRQCRQSHMDEHSVTHPVVNTQWKQRLQPCRPPKLSFHKALLNIHQIMTALSQRAGAEQGVAHLVLQSPQKTSSGPHPLIQGHHLLPPEVLTSRWNIPTSFLALNFLLALQTRCSFVGQQSQKWRDLPLSPEIYILISFFKT